MRLIKFLSEQNMDVSIVIGRFNPPHKGHISLIEAAAKNSPVTFVVVVEGKQTGTNKEKNPLPGSERVKLLNSVLSGNIKAILGKSAYLPDVFEKENPSELELVKDNKLTIFCGADRVNSYKGMAPRIDKALGSTTAVKELDFDRAGVSASLVRKLMREGSFAEAQKYLPYPVSKIEKWF